MATNRGNHMKQIQQRGVSLIEVSAVLTITAIIASSAAPGFSGMLERRKIEGVSAELTSDLMFIRSESVSRNKNLVLSFHSTPSGQGCYIIHTGPAGACNCGESGPAQCSGASEEIKTVRDSADSRTRIHANVDHMVYEATRGTATPAGSVYVTGASGTGVRHVVSMTGRMRTCSPDGRMPGYRSC